MLHIIHQLRIVQGEKSNINLPLKKIFTLSIINLSFPNPILLQTFSSLLQPRDDSSMTPTNPLTVVAPSSPTLKSSNSNPSLSPISKTTITILHSSLLQLQQVIIVIQGCTALCWTNLLIAKRKNPPWVIQVRKRHLRNRDLLRNHFNSRILVKVSLINLNS